MAGNSKESTITSHWESAVITYLSQRGFKLTKEKLGEPFAGYSDFKACMSANADKGDPAAYCGAIKHSVEDAVNRHEITQEQAQEMSLSHLTGVVSKYFQTPQVTQKDEFNTQNDEKVCPLCAPYADKEYDIDDKNKPEIPIHPNCRCYYEEITRDVPTSGKVKFILRKAFKPLFGETMQLEGGLKVVESLQAQSFSWYPNIENLKELSKEKKGKFLLIEGIHPMVTDPFNMGHGAREWTEKEVMKATRTAIGKSMNINHTIQLNSKYAHKIVDGDYNETTRTAEYIVYEEDPAILELIREGYITKVSMQGMPRRSNTECTACGTEGCMCKQVPEGVIFGEDDGQGMAYVVTKDCEYMGRKIKAEQPGDWNTSITIAETNSSLESKKGKKGKLLTRESLISVVPEGPLKETLKNEKKLKAVLKEDLQSFNDALASGDALKAVSILANDSYRNMQDAKQSMSDPHPAGTEPSNPPPTKKEEEDANSGMGVDANGMMPDVDTDDKAKKAKEVDDEDEKEMKEAKKAKELTDDLDGDTRKSPGAPKKQTIPDEGVANDNATMKDIKDTPEPPKPKVDGDGKSMNDPAYEELKKEVAGLKESMKNLSAQVAQYQKETTRLSVKPGSVKETTTPTAEAGRQTISKINVSKVRESLILSGLPIED